MLLLCLVLGVTAVDILLDGGFEHNQWEILPSWALCSSFSCSVPAELEPGPHTGSHFLMIYPGHRVGISQKFNGTRYGSCQLSFYLKTTSKIDTFTTVYWGPEIYELSSYQSEFALGGWQFYSIPLSGHPTYLEIEFSSGNTAYAVADDFSLTCSASTWAWGWTIEMIILTVVGGCIFLSGYKLVQQHQLLTLITDKYNLHRPDWMHRKKPEEKETQMEVLKSAFNDDSE
jgi:hypothetical protein